ncbi:MAG: alpha/beta hydrolase [Terriglobia bacterium]
MSWRRAVGIFIILLGMALSALVFLNYLRDIHRAYERISTGSNIVDTPCGPIEYTTAGDGPPILVVHGAGGGFDQGMEFSAPLVQAGFRVIAMSRFGYLRTPLPADASAAAQADAHACLLDALGITKAAVIGASAGAPSSMQLALRHPERTSALVLLVPAAYPFHNQQRNNGAMPKRASKETIFLFDTSLKSDFLLADAPDSAPNSTPGDPSDAACRGGAGKRRGAGPYGKRIGSHPACNPPPVGAVE